MKKTYIIITSIVLALILGACGDNNDTNNLDKNNDPITNNDGVNNNTGVDDNNGNMNDDGTTNDSGTTNEPNANDQVQKMEKLEYIDFELDVKYDNDQDYEADLELEANGSRVEAKIEDDLNGIEIEGDRAFDEVYPLVEQLTIDQNTSKEDVIAQVLEVFDLSPDYNKFELELKFKDGTRKEYEDRK